MKLSLQTVFILMCAALFSSAQTNISNSPAPSPPNSPAAQENAPGSVEAPGDKKPSAEAALPAKSDADAKPYVIGPLDVLYVRVWNNPNLTSMVNVGPDGLISMPLMGEMRADGLTAEQLKQAIKEKLKEFLNTPEVSVEVTKINSKKIFVMGGVGHPGPYPLNGKTTVSEALSSAGGFTGFANQKKIYVLRGTKKFNVNFKDVIAGKHLEQDIVLENGDKIVVPE